MWFWQIQKKEDNMRAQEEKSRGSSSFFSTRNLVTLLQPKVKSFRGGSCGSISQITTPFEAAKTLSIRQREGKAPMISEETPKKSKEQILQEEASLAEAIRLDSYRKEE
ncbi:hypothetical protein Tco_0054452 [Tanacetum coccineum]